MKLQLYYPIKPNVVNQSFGLGSAFYAPMKGHDGIDFGAKHGQPVYAAHDGRAQYQVDGSGGHGVIVLSNQPFLFDDGKTCYVKTIYWHFCDPLKEPQYPSPISDKGDWVSVTAGDLLGYADSTGNSTGTHLHFGMKRIIQSENSYIFVDVDVNNGYKGASDPAPYFNGVYAEDLKPHQAPTYIRDLTIGSVGDDVKRLQVFLNDSGYSLANSGVGSKGHESNYFGTLTRSALAKFQKAHSIAPSVGYFGPITRAFINNI